MAIRNITDSHSFYKRLYVDCPGDLWYSDSGRKEFAAAEKELAGEAGEMRDIFAIE